MGSHFVYNHVIYIHKIGHNIVKLAFCYWVYYHFGNILTL